MKTEREVLVDQGPSDPMDVNPFGYPDVMNGYPLEPGEKEALNQLLAEFRRRHADERSTSGGLPASEAEPLPG